MIFLPDTLTNQNLTLFFVETNLNLKEFFALLNNEDPSTPVYYLQSQNGNLSEDGELSSLSKDIGTGPSFAREFFRENFPYDHVLQSH